MLKALALNFFLLLFFLFFLIRVFRWFRTGEALSTTGKLLSGVISGVLGVCLLYSGLYADGFLFDIRSIAALIAVYFGGWISGFTAILIMLIPRAFLDVTTLPRVIFISFAVTSICVLICLYVRSYWGKWLAMTAVNGLILGVYAYQFSRMPLEEYVLPYAIANAAAALLVAGYLEFLIRNYSLITGMEQLRHETAEMLRLQPGLTFLFIKQPDGSFLHTMAEGQFFNVLQETPQLILNRPILPEQLPGNSLEHYEKAWSGSDTVYETEYRGRTILTFLKPIRSSNGTVREVIGTVIDMTERKEAERRAAESERRRQEAQAAAEAKSQFLAKMSHELRTPLNGVIGLTQLLQRTDVTALQADYLDKIMSSSRHLLHTINDILDFSKLEAGRMELHPVRLSIRDWAERMKDTAYLMARGKEIAIQVHIDQQCPEAIMADELRLDQIMLNVISNAVKFTEEGTVTVSVIMRTYDAARCTLTFSVQDTGIGMTEEHMKHVLQPFGQADASISRKYGGTGLGLVICNELLALMDSSLEITSRYGEGSEFAFTAAFPLASSSTS